MTKNDIVRDNPPRDKSRLAFVNEMIYDTLKSFYEHFGYDFVQNCTTWDGSKLFDGRWVLDFWDQSDWGVVYRLVHVTCGEKV